MNAELTHHHHQLCLDRARITGSIASHDCSVALLSLHAAGLCHKDGNKGKSAYMSVMVLSFVFEHAEGATSNV